MPQFQAEVPRPLRHDLPGFLSPGRVATPAVGLKLLVFILQSPFKGTTVQVKRHYIRGSEGALGKVGPEEFIDHSVPDEPDLSFLFLPRWSGVSRHNDTNGRTILVQVLVWTVVERAADSTHLALRNC